MAWGAGWATEGGEVGMKDISKSAKCGSRKESEEQEGKEVSLGAISQPFVGIGQRAKRARPKMHRTGNRMIVAPPSTPFYPSR